MQLRNGAANALKQLRGVKQISFKFVSEHSRRDICHISHLSQCVNVNLSYMTSCKIIYTQYNI